LRVIKREREGTPVGSKGCAFSGIEMSECTSEVARGAERCDLFRVHLRIILQANVTEHLKMLINSGLASTENPLHFR